MANYSQDKDINVEFLAGYEEETVFQHIGIEVAVMKLFSSLVTAALLLVLSSGVMAQDEDEEEFVKDFMEVAVYGGLSVPMGGITDWSVQLPDIDATESLGAKTGFDYGFDVGYFWTLNLVTGVTFTVHQYTIDSDSSAVDGLHHRIYSPAAYAKYYFFGNSNLVPYVKAHAGVDIPKFTTKEFDSNVGNNGGYEYRELAYDPAFAFGFGAGAFYYTSDYSGFFIEANYHTCLSEKAGGSYQGRSWDFGENISLVEIHAGIKVFFGSE